jgi:transketolase
MGELVREAALTCQLIYVPRREFDRLLSAPLEAHDRARVFATACRLNVLYMIARAGSGHIGSSFSAMDIVTWLHLNELGEQRHDGSGDLFFSSKGHDAPALYSVLLALGRLPFDLLHELRRLGGLPGHPDIRTPGIVTNTGSLGMGISKAKGLLLARRLKGRSGRLFVMTGDGELQEGQIWESLLSAPYRLMSELTVIVDHNKIQSDTLVARTSPLGNLEAKFAAFDWHVQRIDGHDFRALAGALSRARGMTMRPQVILADTVKGRGVSFMEYGAFDSDTELYKFHSGAPDSMTYERAAEELLCLLRVQCKELGLEEVQCEIAERPAAPTAPRLERLIPAYAKALATELENEPGAVVLDADLAVDTGQMPAKERFPERFFECGIAEQDMVSMAGGMALGGLLPICHSFACFLSARANEHIYNNATESSRVIYVASLAGVLPAGPGHSHQAVRDLSAVGGIPNLTVYAPSCEAEVGPALAWAVREAKESVWLRLSSVAIEVPFELPRGYHPKRGVGITLRSGTDAVFVTYGPVLLAEAWHAAQLLNEQGLDIGVVNQPWLNAPAPLWFDELAMQTRHIVVVDEHYVIGGLGDRLASLASQTSQKSASLHRVALEELPACGQNGEVLKHHGLDRSALAARAREIVAR